MSRRRASSNRPPAGARVSSAADVGRALVVGPDGQSYEITHTEPFTIGRKAEISNVVIDCDAISPRHCVIDYYTDASAASDTVNVTLLHQFVARVYGANGMTVNNQHRYPSSIKHSLKSKSVLYIPCHHSHHSHCYQFVLAKASETKRSATIIDSNSHSHGFTASWSDAERLRFQRAFMAHGVHGLDGVKRMAALSKKNEAQILNYAISFMLESRALTTEQDEKLYIDTVINREQWRAEWAEPSLHNWKKLQDNASTWIKRLRTIQLLEDIVVKSLALDVDVLSLLPKSARKIQLNTIPAPWWNSNHDRLLLLSVYDHGYCRYEDIKTDKKYKFLVSRKFYEKNKSLIQQYKNLDERRRHRKSRPRPGAAAAAGGGGSVSGKGETEELGDDKEDDEPTEELLMDDIIDISDFAAVDDGVPDTSGGTAIGSMPDPSDDLLDITNNDCGLSFPAADQLTRRMRKLIENQRKFWWKRDENENEKERSFLANLRVRRRVVANETAYNQLKFLQGQKLLMSYHQQFHSNYWTLSQVKAFVHAVIQYGIELDAHTNIIDWSKITQKCRFLRDGDSKQLSLLTVLRQVCDNYFLLSHCGSRGTLGNILSSIPALITVTEGTYLTQSLLFFAMLRTRLLSLSRESFLSLLANSMSVLPINSKSELPVWYQPSKHDYPLLLGIAKHGIGQWQAIVDDLSLGWSDSDVPSIGMLVDTSMIDDADREVDAINDPVHIKPGVPAVAITSAPLTGMESMALWARAQLVVNILSSLSPHHARSLMTTFSAFCSYLPPMFSHGQSDGDSSAAKSMYDDFVWDNANDCRVMLPSLTRYEEYLASNTNSSPPPPPTSHVSMFDVTPLSVTAVGPNHTVWRSLVAHRTTKLKSSATVIVTGGVRDLHQSFQDWNFAQKLILNPSLQPIFPIYYYGGLTVLAIGTGLDGRCQLIDEREGSDVYLCPIGFTSVRVHQSLIEPNRMALYRCEIIEIDRTVQTHDAISPASLSVKSESEVAKTEHLNADTKSESMAMKVEESPPVKVDGLLAPPSRLAFRVTCSDAPHSPLLTLTPQAAWSIIDDCIYDIVDAPFIARSHGSHGFERFGLTHPLVREMIEKLGGIETCTAYRKQQAIGTQCYVHDQE